LIYNKYRIELATNGKWQVIRETKEGTFWVRRIIAECFTKDDAEKIRFRYAGPKYKRKKRPK
jgi:hypothetical protein